MIDLAHLDADARTVLVEARRRAVLTRQRSISSREILAAVVATPEVTGALQRADIDVELVKEQLGEDLPPPEHLLANFGIDLSAVRSRLPSSPHSPTSPWRLRRSKLRPLRITLDSPSATMPFAGTGRKVVEVAIWNGRRHGRVASCLDILRGVMSDGADPVVYVLAASGTVPFRRLLHELARLDHQTVSCPPPSAHHVHQGRLTDRRLTFGGRRPPSRVPRAP